MRSIRATVLKTDYNKGLVRVRDDGNDDVIDGIYVLCGFSHASRLPDKGQQVLVLMDDDIGTGYVLGEFWNGEGMKPPSGTKKDNWKADVKNVDVTGKEITVKASSVTCQTDKGTTVI